MRPQTIFLLLAAASMGLSFLFPFGYAAGTEGIFADGELTHTDNIALLILSIIAILEPISSLFFQSIKYDAKKYRMQRLFAQIGMLSAFVVLGLAAYFLFASGVATPAVGVSLFLPPVAVVLAFFAIRQINQDETVIRSSNRIR